MTKTVTLGEIAKITSGGTPDRKKNEYFIGGTIPWVKTGDLKVRHLYNAGENITELGVKNSSATIFPADTVLIALYGATIGACSILKIPAATNQACGAILPSQSILPEFLYYYVAANREKLVEAGVGGAQPNISGQILKNLKLLLPPLPRQRQIAAMLDRADSLRQKDHQLLAHYDQLAQSTFMDLFGDPVRNEKGWPTESIRSLSSFITDGPFGSNLKTEHYRANGVRVIRLNNIGVGEFLDDNKAFVSVDHYQKVLKKNTCLPGDVVIGTLGEPNLRACIVPDYVPLAINKADCVLCKPNAKKIIAHYLTAVLNNPGTLSLASSSMRGQTRVRISMGQVAMLKIAVPPIALQQQFTTLIDRIEQQKAMVQQQVIGSESLFQRLLQDSFGV